MLQNHIKLALRHLAKHKLFTAIKLVGLAAGIAACLLIGLYLHNELTYDDCHLKADRIAKVNMEYSINGEVTHANVTGTKAATSLVRDWEAVEAAVRIMPQVFVIRHGERLQEEPNVYMADANFFEVLSFPLLAGDPKTALNGPNQIVLTETSARRYFGEGEALGQVLNLGGTRDAIVTGVMADPPINTHLQPDFVYSFLSSSQSKPENETWWNANCATYLLLDQPSSIASIQAKMRSYMESKTAETGSGNGSYVTFHLLPLRDVHLRSTVPGNFVPNGDVRYLYILAAVAFLILLIGCTTYVNLATATSVERAREVGIQKVMGAGRAQLAAQHIGEAALLTLCALLLGTVLSVALLPAFNQLFERQLSLAPLAHPVLWVGILCGGLLLGLLAGFYPAMVVARFQPVQVLKGQFKFSSAGTWLRQALVVLQFVISITLLICTLLLQQQMQYIQAKKLGYDKDHVIALPADQIVNERYAALKARLLEHPDIQSVAMSYDSPVHIKGGYSIGKTHHPQDNRPVTALPAGADFLETAGIALVAGSDLVAADLDLADRTRTDSTVLMPILLNEAQVSALGWTPAEAPGQRVSFYGGWCTVKGVVRDFHFASLHEPVAPLVIFPSSYGRFVLVKTSGQQVTAVLRHMSLQWEALMQHRPFSAQFLDAAFDQMYAAEIQTARIIHAFTWLALLLTCLGLFGLASYSFVQRTKEIGIRKVLGATVGSILVLLSKDFLRLVLIALAFASPLAYFLMHQWLQGFAYRTHIGWGAFALAGLAALAIALLAIVLQGWSAATTNPVKRLRAD